MTTPIGTPGNVKRWTFNDLAGDTYTFPVNPNKMTSVFGQRALNAKTVTAPTGSPVVFEGQLQPFQWTFSGDIFDRAHYQALQRWTYSKGRVTVTDHYLRTIVCVLQTFAPIPKRANGLYWRHTYDLTALVLGLDDTNSIDPTGAVSFA